MSYSIVVYITLISGQLASSTVLVYTGRSRRNRWARAREDVVSGSVLGGDLFACHRIWARLTAALPLTISPSHLREAQSDVLNAHEWN